ncbi:LysE/ArgO family amino acid transporter [Kitasatospora sp. NPDC092039]|uniref:LysE/ArgO family amino acid transporter n=1 Tax=Kitasatospora sp. NPDC092039 TaxID=3364086 RepID=UPI0038056E5C
MSRRISAACACRPQSGSPSTIAAAVAGFGTGLSLIVAVGAQNALVLRQGARRQAVLAVVAVCAASDAALIALGVTGVGTVVTARPASKSAVGLVGGAFLLCYGVLTDRRVLRPDPAAALTGGGPAAVTVRRAVLTCLAITWLNPHVPGTVRRATPGVRFDERPVEDRAPAPTPLVVGAGAGLSRADERELATGTAGRPCISLWA